jgi:hypothetical protein
VSLCTVSWLETNVILFLLTFASWCHTVRLEQQSANIFRLHFPLYLFSIWDTSWWSLSPCSTQTAPMFSGRNIPNGNATNNVSMTRGGPQQCNAEIGSGTISLWFSAFLLPRTFLQTFTNASQVVPSVEFNFVLKSWCSNSYWICGPPKFLLSSWPIFGKLLP